MIKRFLIAIVLLALLGGGIVGFNLFRANAIQSFFANRPVVPLPVATAIVEPAPWMPGIEAIGTVGASRGVDLTVETTGIVKELLFTANQDVEQGDVLVHLDDAVQQADLAAARSSEALAAQALERAVALQRRGVSTDATVDSARAEASSTTSNVAKLAAVVEQKRLRAPFSGTLGIPRIEVGQYVAPGNTVATLQNLDTMRADFSVPEQQLGHLSIGQPVSFGLTAADMPFTGRITGIEPKVDPASRLVAVRAEIANPDRQLSPGQFVQVRVELPTEENVIAIPQTALVSSLYGDFVYVVRETPPAEGATAPSLQAAQVFVKPGRRTGGRVEITEGVKAGDQVVIAGQNRLSNGTPVVVDNTVVPTLDVATGASAQ